MKHRPVHRVKLRMLQISRHHYCCCFARGGGEGRRERHLMQDMNNLYVGLRVQWYYICSEYSTCCCQQPTVVLVSRARTCIPTARETTCTVIMPRLPCWGRHSSVIELHLFSHTSQPPGKVCWYYCTWAVNRARSINIWWLKSRHSERGSWYTDQSRSAKQIWHFQRIHGERNRCFHARPPARKLSGCT